MLKPTPLDVAIFTAGGHKALANLLGINPASIYQWVKQGRFPVPRAMQLERLTDGVVPRRLTRPQDYKEIWPDLAD